MAQVSDYHFDLPSELIAQEPSQKRTQARLLLVRRDPRAGEARFEDLLVSDLPKLLELPELSKALWFRNTTQVIPARFYSRRPTGGRHEIVLIEPLDEACLRWKCLIRGEASFRYPQVLHPEKDPNLSFTVPEFRTIEFPWSPYEWLQTNGEMPLPPYITVRDPKRDRERYQSIWAQQKGSVAAPTASLHFDKELMQAMQSRGASFWDLCLHVGLGTFEPLREKLVEDNRLHQERIVIPAATAEVLEVSKLPKVAVGSTALRTLMSYYQRESNPDVNLLKNAKGEWVGTTQIFLKEGAQMPGIQALFTNFHLPESSLMILVAAFAGSRSLALEAYQHAVKQRYRFFSFGDASLWI